jgi:hypothetical protein
MKIIILKIIIFEIIKTQIFHNAEVYNLQNKNPLKETKTPSRYYNFITNLKFQHNPKKIIFQKSLYKNRPGYLQNP